MSSDLDLNLVMMPKYQQSKGICYYLSILKRLTMLFPRQTKHIILRFLTENEKLQDNLLHLTDEQIQNFPAFEKIMKEKYRASPQALGLQYELLYQNEEESYLQYSNRIIDTWRQINNCPIDREIPERDSIIIASKFTRTIQDEKARLNLMILGRDLTTENVVEEANRIAFSFKMAGRGPNQENL